MKITWDTDKQGCGRIGADDGRSAFVQSDWDCPGVAQSFGWSLRHVPRCHQCAQIADVMPDGHAYHCDTWAPECEHNHTDGTVTCPDCGVRAGDFIAAAGDWLREHDGAKAEDPGYFAE
jgi:hypothetical protein